MRKIAVLLDFVQMRGAGRAQPKFFVTFWRGVFLVNKGVHFFQNANNLGCTFMYSIIYSTYRVPQKKLPLVKVSRGKYYC